MEESKPSSIADIENPDEGKTEESIKCVYLFNCDKTYKLDTVEKLFKDIEPTLKKKLNLAFSIEWHYFALMKMSEECENIISKLKIDVAVFVVHAHESRLSINEDDAGIGYAKIYRALLQATGEKVIIVIGGDDNYKNSIEEQSSVLSQWARRKVSSQFSEEYLDGRESFIFSWDKEHRPIHEEALLHYFDPNKNEDKFVPQAEPATVSREDPEKVEEFQKTSETVAKRSKTETNSFDTREESEALKGQKGCEQASVEHPPETDEEALSSMEEDEDMEESSDEPFEELTLADADNEKDCGKVGHLLQDALTKTALENSQATDTSPSSSQNAIAFLYRDQSDIANIKDLFGDDVCGMNTVKSRDPHRIKELLLSNTSVRSCFIIVESINMKEELLMKSSSKVYRDLLETASRTVEMKIAVILCSKGNNLSSSAEENITEKIEELLGDKGIILWWKGNTKTSRSMLRRSYSYPAPKSTKSAHEQGPVDTTDSTLVLKTRLRSGKISYDEKDVNVRVEEWTHPREMANELLREWHSTNVAELSVYRDNTTGNERTIVTEDLETRLSGLGESVKGFLGLVELPNVGKKVADCTEAGASVIGAGKSIGASVIGSGANVMEAGASIGANVMGRLTSFESADGPPEGHINTPPVTSDPELPPG